MSTPAGGDEAGFLDLLPDAVVVLTEGPTLRWINRAGEELIGRGRDELVGRPCADVLPIHDVEGRNICPRAPLGRRLPMIKGMPERDFELTRSDGQHVPVSLKCAYEKDADDVVRRVVCIVRDARSRRGMDMRTVELISTVSHEIRSPLTSIKGFTKTLLNRFDRFDDDMKKEMLAAANADADRVTRLLGELLDISRLETGRLKLRPERFDLPELLSRIVDNAGAAEEGREIVVEAPEELRLFADPDKVEQVLTNLVENAVKYTDTGTIRVRASQDDSWVTVSVSDEGDGIPRAQLNRLFRKFYSREQAGQPSGTGLGLYICRGLVEAHHGEIDVTSREGVGTTFTVRLPLNPDIA